MKKAVVLGGGGARGSYEIGVWKALSELDYNYEIVTGTSVGSLNGALMSMHSYETACEMWEKIDTGSILEFEIDKDIATPKGMIETINSFTKEALKTKGVSCAPLKELLTETVDEEKIRASDVEFGLVTVEVPRYKPKELYTEDIPKGRLVDYLIASSAVYPAMQSMVIDGKMYIDGGYYDNIPVEMAVKKGAEEVVAVGLNALGIIRKINFDGVKVHYITPKWDLGAMLVFDQNRAYRNITLGYNECMKYFERYEGYKYTFFIDESRKNFTELESTITALEAEISRAFITDGRHSDKKVIGYALAKCFKNRYGIKKLTPEAMLTAAGEAAAEILGIPPLEIFTFEKLNFRLINLIIRHSTLPYDDIEVENNPAMSLWECVAAINKTISPINSFEKMQYILSCLADFENLEKNKKLILMFTLSSTYETVAAFYLLIIAKYFDALM